jgi:hypothetical protein
MQKKDLIILVADKNTEFLLQGLLPRLPKILSTKEFTFDIKIHPLRDAGVRIGSIDFLRPFITNYDYAIVLFDYEGSRTQISQAILTQKMQDELDINGWQNRNVVIIIEPEIENWIWVNSPHLAHEIDWEDMSTLENWLIEKGFKNENDIKPLCPKEAFEDALKEKQKPRSSAIYKNIAQKASFKGCIDSNFDKFKTTIQKWF